MDNVSRFVWLYASVVLLVVRLVQHKTGLNRVSLLTNHLVRIAITGDRASPKWTHKPSWARLAEGNNVRQIGTILTVKRKGNFHRVWKGGSGSRITN